MTYVSCHNQYDLTAGTGMYSLTAGEIDQLVKLLSPALNSRDLARFVHLGTGEQLSKKFVGEGMALDDTLYGLLLKLEELAITDHFLRVVYRERTLRPDLLAFIAQRYPAIAATSTVQPVQFEFQTAGAASGKDSEGPALERVVRPRLPTLEAGVWLDRFEQISRQVCRIEADDAGIGTGFLVGPGAVLTNWHVMRESRKRRAADRLVCRFDYRQLTGSGVAPGIKVKVESSVDERPCSDAELTADPDEPPPEAGELDYALLQLATALPDRGWLTLADPPPVAAGAPLVIVQHPDGEPLKFAIDTDAVIGLVHNGLRLRYHTNTKAGSSGSPCFSLGWDLLALHHLGDPASGPGTFNQGVPVGLIRASIESRGHAGLLGDAGP